jgi:hypothetical protein
MKMLGNRGMLAVRPLPDEIRANATKTKIKARRKSRTFFADVAFLDLMV